MNLADNEKEKELWNALCNIKSKIYEFLNSANSGICTHAVKFLETMLLTFSDPSVGGNATPFKPGGFDLSTLPESGFIITRPELLTQGHEILKALLNRLEDDSLPASNVTAIINSLTVIVKQRTQFIMEITDILVSYHTNIPEKLTKTQKKSITHALKMAMNVILKLHITGPWNDKLQQCLSGRIAKGTKRKANQEEFGSSKIAKTQSRPYMSHLTAPSGIPINANTKFVINPQSFYHVLQLPLEMVTELVLENLKAMVVLEPQQMSPLDPRSMLQKQDQLEQSPKEPRTIKEEEVTKPNEKMIIEDSEPIDSSNNDQKQEEDGSSYLPPSIGSRSLSRLLQSASEKSKRLENNPAASYTDDVIISKIASILPLEDQGIKMILDFISHSISLNNEDRVISGKPSQAKNIILYWLHLEYVRLLIDNSEENQSRYDEILNRILLTLSAITEDIEDSLFASVIINLPLINENVFLKLREYCEDPVKVIGGLSTLRELVVLRPFCREQSLEMLLSFVGHQDDIICTEAIKLITQKKVLQAEHVYQQVKDFALKMMNSLNTEEYLSFVSSAETKQQIKEVSDLQEDKQEDKSQPIVQEINAQIIENDIEKRLLLFTALCLKKHELVRDFLEALEKTSNTQIKRVMLRIYGDIIRKIGQNSEGLLNLISSYPLNLDRYILRALHILTDRVDPIPTLVKVVLDVYKNTKDDPRLLIFILTGLSREEVIHYLPTVVALPKEDLGRAINRLLDPKRNTSLKPADLLVQLHLINAPKHELPWEKLVEATQFCFNKPDIVVNKEVLASVLQQLVDIKPLPHLFMRTVNQTIEKCAELTSFVMGILSKLISKQIWADEVQWRGFIMACSKSLPHSVHVILQLPAKQFENVLVEIPNLKERIMSHLEQTNKMNSVPIDLQRILDAST